MDGREGIYRFCGKYLATLTAGFMTAGAVSASGQTVEIGFLGLDLVFGQSDVFDDDDFFDDGFVVAEGTFDGFGFTDAGSPDGGGGDAALSDPLTAVTIEIDDVLQGPVLTENIFADVNIPVQIPLPDESGVTTVVSGAGIFDILIGPEGIDNGGILVNVDSVSITFVDADTTSFVFGAEVSSDIFDDNLPFGIATQTPVEISFNVVVDPDSLEDDGEFITAFTAQGSGTLRFVIPEPGSLMVLGLSGGLMLLRRRSY